jgi:cytochrome P450
MIVKLNIEMYTDLINEKAEELANVLEEKVEIEDVFEYTQKVTLDVLGRAAFGHEFNSLKGSIQKDLLAYRHFVESITDPLYSVFPFLAKVPFLQHNKKANEALEILFDLYTRLINESQEKMKNSKKPQTMLDFMVKSSQGGNGLSFEDIRNNVALFFIAGHETTASAIAFAIFALARYPHIQQKLRNEIETKIGNRTPTYDEVMKLDYLHQVIQETLRMYAPASVTTFRITKKTITLGNYKIPKGVS